MNEWNIQSRAHACQACERHFADKEHFHTVLLTNKHELIRQDICLSCWETKHAKAEGERKGFISQWQGVYHAPASIAHAEPIQKENAETLLRKLIETTDPKYGPACYILAVMLERKRLLKVKEQFKREGTRVFIYEHPKTGDVFTITDPDLQLNQLEEVQRDVSELLAHGLTPAAGSPAPTTESAKPEDPAQPENSEAATTSEPVGPVPSPGVPESPENPEAATTSEPVGPVPSPGVPESPENSEASGAPDV